MVHVAIFDNWSPEAALRNEAQRRARVREQLAGTVTADGTILSAMLYTPETIDPKKPVLAIIGSEDDLFKRPGVRDRLKAGYKGRYEELMYPGGTHGLRESRERVAVDVDTWIRKTFP